MMPSQNSVKEIKRLMINMPNDLYEELARKAAEQRRSVTGQLIYFIEAALNKETAKEHSKATS